MATSRYEGPVWSVAAPVRDVHASCSHLSHLASLIPWSSSQFNKSVFTPKSAKSEKSAWRSLLESLSLSVADFSGGGLVLERGSELAIARSSAPWYNICSRASASDCQYCFSLAGKPAERVEKIDAPLVPALRSAAAATRAKATATVATVARQACPCALRAELIMDGQKWTVVRRDPYRTRMS